MTLVASADVKDSEEIKVYVSVKIEARIMNNLKAAAAFAGKSVQDYLTLVAEKASAQTIREHTEGKRNTKK